MTDMTDMTDIVQWRVGARAHTDIPVVEKMTPRGWETVAETRNRDDAYLIVAAVLALNDHDPAQALRGCAPNVTYISLSALTRAAVLVPPFP